MARSHGLERKGVPYRPWPVSVDVDDAGHPIRIDQREVEMISEEWLVSDRWWTPQPLRRHYYELICAGGANVTVYRDATSDDWFRQRA